MCSNECLSDLETIGLAPWYDSFADCYSSDFDAYRTLDTRHKLPDFYTFTEEGYLVLNSSRNIYFRGRDPLFKPCSDPDWEVLEFEVDDILCANSIVTPIAMSNYIRKKRCDSFFVTIAERLHENNSTDEIMSGAIDKFSDFGINTSFKRADTNVSHKRRKLEAQKSILTAELKSIIADGS